MAQKKVTWTLGSEVLPEKTVEVKKKVLPWKKYQEGSTLDEKEIGRDERLC